MELGQGWGHGDLEQMGYRQLEQVLQNKFIVDLYLSI